MFHIGQHVTAQWTTGDWYGARILQISGPHYEVAWDDGSPNLWIGAHQIQPDAGGGARAPMGGGGQFMPGQHVRAQWTNGGMYGARILQGNGSHYEVAWDDGSPNLWVGAHQVQPDAGGGAFAPMGGAPMGGAPMGGAPMGGAPMGGAPMGGAPMGGAPMGGGGQFMPGQHVRAQWTNGGMYGARIVRGNGSQYEMAWDDGSPNLWVGAHQIQPDPVGAAGAPMGGGMGGGMMNALAGGGGEHRPGEHVVAQYTNGSWYGARVLSRRGDHYELAWDDGSPNLWVTAHQIRGG